MHTIHKLKTLEMNILLKSFHTKQNLTSKKKKCNKYKNPCNLSDFSANDMGLAQNLYFVMPDKIYLLVQCKILYFCKRNKLNKNIEVWHKIG